MDHLTTLALSDLVSTAISDWIGPVFVAVIAVVAIVLLWQKKLAAFITFAAVAVLAGLFIFFGDDLFGKSGNLSGAGKQAAEKINVINLASTTQAPGFLQLKG
jgi:uncharacterized membrane protein YqiK